MPISSQVIHSLEINLLKNIRHCKIEFKPSGLTGILGPNGAGKSTIIYSLLCLYQPRDGSDRENYKFSNFFTPTNYNPWAGSNFKLIHSYRDGPNEFLNRIVSYGKKTDRWSPRYQRRPKRYIKFIGVKDSIPVIELEKKDYIIRFNTSQLTDARSQSILSRVGRIMNRTYTALNQHTATHNQVYIGVEYNGINYTSLNMGAGEQKIFKIISEVEKSPNNGLLIIDEIDILIHHDALKRLLAVLNQYCIDKSLQIIFTTHNHSVLEIDYIDFKHIQQTPQKTVIHNNTNTDSLFRLTGAQIRPYEIFVEDELSKYIVNKIASELGAKRETSIKKFGSIFNGFTVASAARLIGLENFDNMLFVLDGDDYRTNQQKQSAINKVLTGNVPGYAQMRSDVLSKIVQYELPVGLSPEIHIKNLISALDRDDLNVEEQEMFDVMSDNQNPLDNHEIVTGLQNRLGLIQGVTLTYLINLLAKSPGWITMTQAVRDWLNGKVH